MTQLGTQTSGSTSILGLELSQDHLIIILAGVAVLVVVILIILVVCTVKKKKNKKVRGVNTFRLYSKMTEKSLKRSKIPIPELPNSGRF